MVLKTKKFASKQPKTAIFKPVSRGTIRSKFLSSPASSLCPPSPLHETQKIIQILLLNAFSCVLLAFLFLVVSANESHSSAKNGFFQPVLYFRHHTCNNLIPPLLQGRPAIAKHPSRTKSPAHKDLPTFSLKNLCLGG